MSRSPYEVLGVSQSASLRQIRAAYVARARTAHPDLVGGRGLAVMRARNAALRTGVSRCTSRALR